MQTQAIGPIRAATDVVIQAKSGMGKTGAFVIGLLDRIDTSGAPRAPQALVLSPVRELAVQTNRVVEALGLHLGIKAASCVGGTPVSENRAAIAAGAHVVSGTPGRVLQLIERGWLSLDSIRVVCLDEADELLSDDFMPQMRAILTAGLPESVQVVMFSATMSDGAEDVAANFMVEPVTVRLADDDTHLAGIEQYYVECRNNEDKLSAIIDLYERLSATQSILFCSSRAAVDSLSAALRERDFGVSSVHADMEQWQRDEVVEAFRAGSTRVLVTTDVLARGFDVQTVSMVVNVELPREFSTYTHRIGRSGRHGRRGVAVSLVTARDRAWMAGLEGRYGVGVKPLPAELVQEGGAAAAP